ncbi:uncharacterized protein B0H18DRAFT_1211786, partial [Fomitopsis serialis]|uniref:uncharacterized protein n=1 Tax=Fomitopsis serialis TaxID=139415 RepID=UPI002007D183
MSAKRALSVPDILLYVFEQLQPQAKPMSDLHPAAGLHIDPTANGFAAAALARSARVCKDFQEPALSILWRDIPSFVVLLGLLPRVKQAIWEHTGRSVYANYGIEPNEVERGSWQFTPINPEIYRTLFQHNNSQPILPCLEELEWLQTLTIASLHTVLTPSLRRLAVYLQWETFGLDSSARRRVVVDVLSASPRLEHLALLGAWNFNFLGVTSESFSFETGTLQSLDLSGCGELSSQVILQLTDSSLPALTALRICVLDHLEAFVQPPAFRNLNTLSMTGYAEDLASFLAIANLPVLSQAHLHLNDRGDTGTAFSTLSGALSSAILPNLRQLAVRSTMQPGHMMRTAVFPDRSLLAVIRPILSLTELRGVSLDFGTFDAWDDDIRQITQSWRKLRTLELCSCATGAWSPNQFSLHALVHVARNCPDLQSLKLRPLRHDDDVLQPAIGDTAARPHGLQALHTYRWQVRPTKED